jgi:hypothetical protein
VFSLASVPMPTGYEPRTHCTGSIGPTDSVAVVRLKGQPYEHLVLRDYADLANPRTVCTIKDRLQQLIDARHIVIQACGTDEDCAMAVVDLPEATYHWFKLPQAPGTYGHFLAVSPDLKELVWSSTRSRDGDDRRVHLTTAAGDRTVARLIQVGGRCGSPEDSKQGAFSQSGEHFYVLDVPAPSLTVFVVIAHGERRFSLRPPGDAWPAGAEPAMAVWSPNGEALYYRRNGHAWRWTEETGARKFLDGVAWRHPSFSPDGRFLAYSVPRSDGLRDVYLMDISAGTSPKLIGQKRTQPVFLNNEQLWFLTQGGEGCVSGGEKPQPMIYAIRDGSQASSIIHSPVAVWPATSSNY